jgi:LacI family repressor for deo operon, udp, cdd, tsx, nupC, and nupG
VFPTAVFGANDQLAIGALSACRQRQIRVPEEVAIAGFDDIELASFGDVSLTTIAFEAEQLGDIATNRLISLIENPHQTPSLTLIESKLTLRKSSVAVA